MKAGAPRAGVRGTAFFNLGEITGKLQGSYRACFGGGVWSLLARDSPIARRLTPLASVVFGEGSASPGAEEQHGGRRPRPARFVSRREGWRRALRVSS